VYVFTAGISTGGGKHSFVRTSFAQEARGVFAGFRLSAFGGLVDFRTAFNSPSLFTFPITLFLVKLGPRVSAIA
jgi:hypothetical protein